MNGKQNGIYIVAGLDIGNGYVKGLASANGGEPTGIDFLSGSSIYTSTDAIEVRDSDAAAVIDDIFNMAEVTFDSAALRKPNHYLIGRRAADSGKSLTEFDVMSPRSKVLQPLSSMLVLSSLAGKALQAYYGDHGSLPTDIVRVHARIALALPIKEYKNNRKSYAEMFTQGSHMVNIYNFSAPLRFEVVIDDVQVLAEGAAAQFAIIEKGEPLMNAMMSDLRGRGVTLEGITAADILSAKNTIGIDIGEGTVNFPVFQHGKFTPDVSWSMDRGYGTVMEHARASLAKSNIGFNSRKALVDYCLQEPSAMQRFRHVTSCAAVDEEIGGFVQEIQQEFTKVLQMAGTITEVIYVYGGGATPLKEYLYPLLLDVMAQTGGLDMAPPVLYLDSKYSRYLNREGLYSIANHLATAAAANAQPDVESA